MARVSCTHCGCNRSFTSEGAMLQHFTDSHGCTATYNHAAHYTHNHDHVSGDHVAIFTDADRVYLQCRKCGRSFNSKPALEQHCRDTGHDLHGIASMVSSPQQTLASIIGHDQLPGAVGITDLMSQCRKCGRSFNSKPALEQHRRDTGHDVHGVAAMVSSPQQTLASIIGHRLPADVGITDLNHRLMAALTLTSDRSSAHDIVGRPSIITTSGTHSDGKDRMEIMMDMVKVSCDDCGRSFIGRDALHQHQWDSAYHTRVSRCRMPTFGSNFRECSQCAKAFSSPYALEQHFIFAHPLTEITFGDEHSTETWMHVANKFKLAWPRASAAAPPPKVHKIFKVNNMGGRRRKYEEYRATLKKQMTQMQLPEGEDDDLALEDVRRRVLKDGNELQRYHGTRVRCGLGRLQSGAAETWPPSDGGTLLCSADGCGLCGILKEGFRADKCRVSRFQRFGRGIYVSASSGKADAYVRMGIITDDDEFVKVMLVTKVLAGRMYSSARSLADLTRPPPGFHSVQGVPGPFLDYDELVLYDDRAILPDYIIFYSIPPLG